MKGILLAGGSGKRLYPLTVSLSKQLLPVYNKPMVYYPLSVLMLAGIRELLLISTEVHRPQFQQLLGSGKQWGIEIKYATQEQPRGLADAFLLGAEFIDYQPCGLILGDNIFYGTGLWDMLRQAARIETGAHLFAYPVRDPAEYGVVEFDEAGKVIRLEEKPRLPRSHFAITGLYLYDSQVCEIARELSPSKRGELEITDINRKYMEMGKLKVELLGRGVAWLDAGTPGDLMQAASFVHTVEERQGLLIGSPEEVAFRMGFISRAELNTLIQKMPRGNYRHYLSQLTQKGNR